MKKFSIGTIDVTGDKIIACDPCRREAEGVWYNTVIENMLPGKYVAEITKLDNEETHGLGDRVAELTIRHQDYGSRETTEKITDDAKCVGVDSGQVMFANLDAFNQILEDPQEGEAFYWRACEATEGVDKAGIRDNVVVSRSGYGDGDYDVYVGYNDDGKVVAASVEFIQEGED